MDDHDKIVTACGYGHPKMTLTITNLQTARASKLMVTVTFERIPCSNMLEELQVF